MDSTCHPHRTSRFTRVARDGARSTAGAGIPYLAVLLSLVLSGLGSGSRAAQEGMPPGRPNIIFIIVDDMRRDQMGFLSPETALTPHLDRLAREGVRFRNGFATSTVCTPSRYTCLSGRYPSQCRSPAFTRDVTEEGMTVVGFNTSLEMDRPNIPRVLKEAGYRTGIVGKWHIGVHDYREEVPPPGSSAVDPDIAALLRRNQAALVRSIMGYGFDTAEHLVAGNALDSPSLRNTGMTAHNMEWLTEAALTFIEENQDRPFYLYLSTTLPHWPPPLESIQGDSRITAAGLLAKPIDVQPSRHEVLQRVREAGLPDEAAASAWIDDGIGTVLTKLEELGIDERTLVLFFNDHGMEHGSKSSLYDGATRTPILAYWPDRIPPAVSDALVSSIDFAPTILEAAGITPPPDLDSRGISFLPVAEGRQLDSDRAFAYSEIGYTRAITGRKWKYLAFRLPRETRLSTEDSLRAQAAFLAGIKQEHPWVTWEPDPDARITHTGGPPGGDFLMRLTFKDNGPFLRNYYDPDQLYDLENDPLETRNLAGDPAYAEPLRKARQAMKDLLRDLPGTFGDLKPLEAP